MGQRTVLTDDLTDRDIPVGKGGTVKFALDGHAYEIDLTNQNAGQLRKALDPFISVARKVGGANGKQHAKARVNGRTATHDDNADIRAWAKENGIEVSERGRIAQSVRDQWKQAQAS